MAGLLVVLEGQDFSGKTEARDNVAEKLRAKGYDVVVTREPGGTPVAEKLREFIFAHKGEVNPMTELMLFQAARSEHIEKVIIPSIQAGKIVVCDRFFLSTYCWQVAPFITETDQSLLQVFGESLQPLIAPLGEMVQVFLDVPKSVRDERRALVGARNSFDDMPAERAAAIEAAYEIIRLSDDVTRVDANVDRDTLANGIVQIVEDALIERDQQALKAQLQSEQAQAPDAQGQPAELPPLPVFKDFVAEAITQAFATLGLPMLLNPKKLKQWKGICVRKADELKAEMEKQGVEGHELYKQVNQGMQWIAQLAHNHETAEQLMAQKPNVHQLKPKPKA